MQEIIQPKIMAMYAIIMFIHTSENALNTFTYTTNASFLQYQRLYIKFQLNVKNHQYVELFIVFLFLLIGVRPLAISISVFQRIQTNISILTKVAFN